jgi:hypothetical protein
MKDHGGPSLVYPLVYPSGPEIKMGQPLVRANPLIHMVGTAGFELATLHPMHRGRYRQFGPKRSSQRRSAEDLAGGCGR